jgi:hypothetical protein
VCHRFEELDDAEAQAFCTRDVVTPAQDADGAPTSVLDKALSTQAAAGGAPGAAPTVCTLASLSSRGGSSPPSRPSRGLRAESWSPIRAVTSATLALRGTRRTSTILPAQLPLQNGESAADDEPGGLGSIERTLQRSANMAAAAASTPAGGGSLSAAPPTEQSTTLAGAGVPPMPPSGGSRPHRKRASSEESCQSIAEEEESGGDQGGD